MAGRKHETLVDMFRRRPSLVLDLLRALGIRPPHHHALAVDPADLPHILPVSYHADLVISLRGPGGRTVLRIILEVQRRRDRRKELSWPMYAAAERARSGCPAIVVVLATTPRVARWAATPIPLGGDNVFRAIVVALHAVPVVTDEAVARANPELAVLSALAHARHAARDRITRLAVAALDAVPEDAAVLYLDLMLAAIGPLVRRTVTKMQQDHVFQSKFMRDLVAKSVEQGREQGLEQGRVATMAAAVLAVLDARGIAVSPRDRKRIATCERFDTLERWLRGATAVATARELFAGEPAAAPRVPETGGSPRRRSPTARPRRRP